MKAFKRIKKSMIFVALAAVMLTCVAGGVLGKFVFESHSEQTSDPEPFYFSCNFSDGGIYYLPGTSTDIIAYNHNQLGNVNPSDVKVDVTYSKIDTNGNPISLSTRKTLTLAKGAEREEKASIISQKGDRYKVTVTTTAPYEQTISFVLIFMEEDAKSFYRITKNGSWLQLDLYIGAEKPATNLTINYAGLAPDNTNPFMADWFGTSGTIATSSLSDHAHYTFAFFGDVGTGVSADIDLTTGTITLLP